MDPLSIATAAVGTTKVLYRASSTIYEFIKDAKIVDKKLEDLRSEFDSTARILEVVRTRLRNPIHLIHARSQDHQGFLDIALAAIQECDNASSEVITKIETIGEGPTWLKSRPVRQIQYKRMQKDILRANTRIRDQKQNLQLLIQMLDVLLSHQSTALLTEKVLPPLSSLQLLIEKASTAGTEVYVHPTNDGNQLALATRTQTAEEVTSMNSGIESATFVGEATSVNSAPESAIPPTDNDKDEEEETLVDRDDIRMIQAFQTQAAELLESKAWANAEKTYLNCLKLFEVVPIDSLPITSMVQAQLGLATAYMYQEKWSQAKELFQFLASSDSDVEAQCLYYLAQIYLAEHKFDRAYTACLEARTKFQSATERSHCNALLVLIAETNEDKASAAIYATGITKDEPIWSDLPFYRFTAKGHGLSIDGEKDAAAWLESQDAQAKLSSSDLGRASASGKTAVVRFLIWQKVPLNETYNLINGVTVMTALMAAAFRGYIDIVRILLDAGANVDVGTRGHKTTSKGFDSKPEQSALYCALRSNSVAITRVIFEAITPNTEEYLKTLELAVYWSAVEPLDFLLAQDGIRESVKTQTAQGSSELLQRAVSGGKLPIVKALLASKLFLVDAGILSEAANAKRNGYPGSDEVEEELNEYLRLSN